MRTAVSGTIATDHLTHFPGTFTEQPVPGRPRVLSLSLSFLVDRIDIRRGGTGANIAFGLGVLGLSPVLIGAAGIPFAAAPSRQVSQLSRGGAQLPIDGARCLFTDEQEAALLQERTGWGARRILDTVGTRVTTLGAAGVLDRIRTVYGEIPATADALLPAGAR